MSTIMGIFPARSPALLNLARIVLHSVGLKSVSDSVRPFLFPREHVTKVHGFCFASDPPESTALHKRLREGKASIGHF